MHTNNNSDLDFLLNVFYFYSEAPSVKLRVGLQRYTCLALRYVSRYRVHDSICITIHFRNHRQNALGAVTLTVIYNVQRDFMIFYYKSYCLFLNISSSFKSHNLYNYFMISDQGHIFCCFTFDCTASPLILIMCLTEVCLM